MAKMNTKARILAQTENLPNGCRIWRGTTRGGRCGLHRTHNGKVEFIDLIQHFGVKKYNLPKETKGICFSTECGNPRCYATEHIVYLGDNVRKQKTLGRKVKKTANSEAMFLISIIEQLVSKSREQVAEDMDLPIGTVSLAQDSVALEPYALSKVVELTGLTIEELRYRDEGINELREKYNLSRYAARIVRNRAVEPVHDMDLYLDLLLKCYVKGEYLIWDGEVVDNKPVIDGYPTNNAISLYVHALTGDTPAEEYQFSTVYYANCLNCYEEIKNA